MEQRECSEWLTTAIRRKPLHRNHRSDRFVTPDVSFDEYDGWVELTDELNNWSPKGYENWHKHHLRTVQR
eukprot:4566195-Pyramimonas_sp.AAC.1